MKIIQMTPASLREFQRLLVGTATELYGAERNPTWNDFLAVVAMRALIGSGALNWAEVLEGCEKVAGMTKTADALELRNRLTKLYVDIESLQDAGMSFHNIH